MTHPQGDEFALCRATIISLLRDNEDWLMRRILDYAHRQDYTQYTSTMMCAWQASIAGLSEALIKGAQEQTRSSIEFTPNQDFIHDALAHFAVEEAILHRKRGIKPGMFLSLLKYYRQAYTDLVDERCADSPHIKTLRHFVLKRFDLLEIALVTEWNSTPMDKVVDELSTTNRKLTNEKNFYLTAFESLGTPAFLLDHELEVTDANQAAVSLLTGMNARAGEVYYDAAAITGHDQDFVSENVILNRPVTELMPELTDFIGKRCDTEAQKSGDVSMTIRDEDYDFFFDQHPLQDISGQFAGSIMFLKDISDRKAVERRLKAIADKDPLTGAGNRRALESVIKSELSRAHRHDEPLSVAILDIDWFKSVNDNYGHLMGDRVLIDIAKLCKDLIRPYDTFARIGGEEFALLLPKTSVPEAERLAERLRQRVAEHTTQAGENRVQVTISIGVALLAKGAKTLEEMIESADRALYCAKLDGRNRVVTFEQLRSNKPA
ncbi:sensor domain-containing diguanylate cyclase [Luminiphilus syltensis]|nr:diguanylate cyclase [Luminiphilus syltensis]